jgi:polyisoprenoid-binding protein YceI
MRPTPSKNLAVLLAAALLSVTGSTSPSPAQAVTYVFDKDQTEVRFIWTRLGLSRQSGRILDAEGTVEFDPENPEEGSVEVTFKVANIRTGVKALDDQLTKTKDFFDAQQFPVIAFRSVMAQRTGETTGKVFGELTINGITKPVALDVTWVFTGPHPHAQLNSRYKDAVVSAFSATATIQRSDWGLTRVIPLVSDEIQITIETELIRKN